MGLVAVAWQSLQNRRVSVSLIFLSLCLSMMLLLGVEQIRAQAKESFSRTVSGVDLIVGAKSGQINLLLAAVFHLGEVTGPVSWQSYETIASDPLVKWSLPLSLGDSHKGFRVVGTNASFFQHYQYGRQQALSFAYGQAFANAHQVVIGAEVAKSLAYRLDDDLVLSHGTGQVSFTQHSHQPFQVVGILAPTGTPVDQSLYVSLAGLAAAHETHHDEEHELHPEQVSAVLVGLHNRAMAFMLQAKINRFDAEALSAIMPALALAQLWQLLAVVENILAVISYAVLLAALLGLATLLLVSMRERHQELMLLRTIGARPWQLFVLIQVEAVLLALGAAFSAWLVTSGILLFSADWLSRSYGLFVSANMLNQKSLVLLGILLLATLVVACIPAVMAYRTSPKN